MVRLPKEVSTTILLSIFRQGEITMTELQKDTGFSTITVLNHVESLMSGGLLEERREDVLPRRRILRLSQDGKNVAEFLNMAVNSPMDLKGLTELGAKVGRMAAYRDVVALLRPQIATRDYVTTELLVRDLELVAEVITIVSRALLQSKGPRGEALRRLGDTLGSLAQEARNQLKRNDITKSAEMVAQAWKEYGSHANEMYGIVEDLKGMKLESLTRIMEFMVPRQAQKG
jgi:DNA-binding MarR family transcriptional regulator